jgi:hypothetical protein
VLSSAAGLWKLFRAQAERRSGIGPKLFGFIPESVFTFIPDHCSDLSRNAVRSHPGTAFTFARIPQLSRRAPRGSPYNNREGGVRLERLTTFEIDNTTQTANMAWAYVKVNLIQDFHCRSRVAGSLTDKTDHDYETSQVTDTDGRVVGGPNRKIA